MFLFIDAVFGKITFFFKFEPINNMSTIYDMTAVIYVLTVLFACIVIAMIVSCIVLSRKKRWKALIISIVANILLLAATAYLLVFLMLFSPLPDKFGKKHPIPDGLEYSIPLSMGESCDTSCLQLTNGGQGGIYRYDFYASDLAAGEVFLRCYEAVEGIQLSENSIPERSKVSVPETTSFTKLVDGKEFTIYEGDWGDYYAARIEVWHKDAATGAGTKLMEKTYRVEGWTR